MWSDKFNDQKQKDQVLNDINNRFGGIINQKASIAENTNDQNLKNQILEYIPSVKNKYSLQVYELNYNETTLSLKNVYLFILMVFAYRFKNDDCKKLDSVLDQFLQKNEDVYKINVYKDLIKDFKSIKNYKGEVEFFKKQGKTCIENIYLLIYFIDYYLKIQYLSDFENQKQNKSSQDVSMEKLKKGFDFENDKLNKSSLDVLVKLLKKGFGLNIIIYTEDSSYKHLSNPKLQFTERINFIYKENEQEYRRIFVMNYDDKKNIIFHKDWIQVPRDINNLYTISILNDIQSYLYDNENLDKLVDSYLFDIIAKNIKQNNEFKELIYPKIKQKCTLNTLQELNKLTYEQLRRYMEQIQKDEDYEKCYQPAEFKKQPNKDFQTKLQFIEKPEQYDIKYYFKQQDSDYEIVESEEKKEECKEIDEQNEMNTSYEIIRSKQENTERQLYYKQCMDEIQNNHRNRQQINKQNYKPTKIALCTKCKQRPREVLYPGYQYCNPCFIRVSHSFI